MQRGTLYFGVGTHLIFLLFSALIISGCSPGMFSSQDRDTNITGLQSGRKPAENCRGLDVSKRDLDEKTFHSVLNCLNTDHSLENFYQFTLKLSPKELSQVIELGNLILDTGATQQQGQILNLYSGLLEYVNSSLGYSDFRD